MSDSSRHPPQRAAARPPSQRPSRWQAAGMVLRSHLARLPEASAGPPPRLSRRGKAITYGIAALSLMLVCAIVWLGGRTAGSTSGGSGTPSPGVSSTATASGATQSPTSAVQQAAAFLAAYFSWSASDTDATYAARWQPSVLSAALPQFIAAEPLATLDQGTDVAAESPTVVIPPQALTQQGSQAHLTVSWTIQVLPEGAEGTTWLPRQVRAVLSLTEVERAGWVVSTLQWSQEGGTR